MVEVQGLGRRATLTGAEACLAAIMHAEAEQLALAGHWADLHDPGSLPAPETELEARRRRRFADEYGVQPGGDGTPEVLACCFAELGLVLQSSAGGAKHLVADALDLRHRLPRLWCEVQTGRVRGWKARKVAQATRHLPRCVMTQVDAGLEDLVTALPWSRLATVLDATVLRADPAGAAYAEAEATSRRFVSLARDDAHGLKTVIARGEVLDILTFLAAVQRIADLLAAEGDPDPLQLRRSTAVGILGQPDRALALLTRHRDDEDRPPAPVELRTPTGWHRSASRASPPDETEPEANEAGDPADDQGIGDVNGQTERLEPLAEDEPG
jgi:hypothetical protein